MVEKRAVEHCRARLSGGVSPSQRKAAVAPAKPVAEGVVIADAITVSLCTRHDTLSSYSMSSPCGGDFDINSGMTFESSTTNSLIAEHA